ncbi:peptidase [Scytonema sp. UIC 10036]|uniref:C2 family cysteine protease n=1 Tax=Scytonema sp. UIC 10036 TaxID=2304196 RepID=UPI0012DA4158|nr:C2 family cysteine protease [Scytonema sp. UIC 10036]MUG91816.1 peptidase [Scytonema sp. UIC 10036]
MQNDFTSHSLNTSLSINLTASNQTFAGSLGRRNPDDCYSFSLSGSSSLSLSLDSLSANADLQLLDGNGSTIAGSHNRHNTDESLGITVGAGTYYIQVSRVGSANTSYNLKAFKNEAPQSLQFNTYKGSYEAGETVNLTNTRVFDPNGANDLARVDFWLQKDGSNWQDISDAVQFTVDNADSRYGSFTYSLNSLSSGIYQLQAKAYDKLGNSTQSTQTTFKVGAASDWFDQNIQDEVIRSATRSRFGDGLLDRNDMVSILRESKDGNVVDATELADIRTLIGNTSYIKISEHVRVLSNKVANNDTANQKYQGNSLGNLVAGSSDVQLENLINKWFYGSDRPQTSYTYQYASGSLFQNGVSYEDIKQGGMNDCYFLAGLASTASRTLNTIESMFIDNGDNTFTIRFWRNGVADYVTVDRYLPTDTSGAFVYASKGSHYSNGGNELWVAFAEKAYAQLNESGWIYQNNTNTYEGIGKGGYMSDAFAQITGKKAALGKAIDCNSIINAFNSGQLVGFGSKTNGVAANIVAGHAYSLVGYDASTQKFTLFNPWGMNTNASKPGIIEVSWSEVQSNFSYWDTTV